jgi:hypothetical protein
VASTKTRTSAPLRPILALSIGLTAALALGACNGGSGSSRASATLGPTPCGTYSGRGCAPDSKRVDLGKVSFSHSTEVTNPYFPISDLRSALFLGHIGREPFRTETTLLPGIRTVTWNGQKIKTRVSQYVAFVGGHLEEVALDKYAQADDGSVWYFGEDVFDYKHGAVALTEGTWLAGREGPAAMIMPGKPTVGQVVRTENIPAIVFEEVTIRETGKTVAGPAGPVRNAIVGSELHQDGTREDKIFAPGYGEFRTAGGGDLEAMALAVPTNALKGPPPSDLHRLSVSTAGILESARVPDWEAAPAALRSIEASWTAFQKSNQPPPMVADRLNHALSALRPAVKAHRSIPTEQAAVDLSQSILDLELRHLPPAEINAARFELWTQQLRVHAAAKNLDGVTGAVAVLEWTRDRFSDLLSPAQRQEIATRLRDLRSAADARNLLSAADQAARLGERVRTFVTSRA